MSDYMNVGNLIDLLLTFPRDMPIVLAQDPEGNGFGRLVDTGESMVDPEDYRPDAVYPTPEHLVDLIAGAGGWTEDDGAPDSATQRALVFWPA